MTTSSLPLGIRFSSSDQVLDLKDVHIDLEDEGKVFRSWNGKFSVRPPSLCTYVLRDFLRRALPSVLSINKKF